MPHREGIRDYLKDVRVYGVVHDWGCGTKPIKNYLMSNEAIFVGIDKLDYVGADIVVNLEEPIKIGDKADFAFCLEVIEHTWQPAMVLENIYSNMKYGGFLYLSQPFLYPVHKGDDRLRFTYHGLNRLLKEVGFRVEDIQPTVGDLDHAEGYVVRARK